MTINSINPNGGVAGMTAGAASSVASASGMNQADFLKLMTAQLQAQDPTKPVDNAQFVSQMAQFSQLSSTQDLVGSVNTLNSTVNGALQSSQLLSSSNLVNRQVLVPSSTVQYAGASVTGAAHVTTAGPLTVNVIDGSGNVVRTISLSNQPAGLDKFTWDGKDDAGKTVPPGTYTLSAGNAGNPYDTYAAGTVTAVGYGGSTIGTYLQVTGVGGVALNQVAQIL